MSKIKISYDLVLKNGTIVTPEKTFEADIGVINGKIAEIGSIAAGLAQKTVDCAGLHILPGVIDSQVHFREPGPEYKEDLATGTLSAVAGGVTAVFEMPNTQPSTISENTLKDKLTRAKNRAWCDYAFYIGGTAENARELARLEQLEGCCGVKVFMGSSTGSLLTPGDTAIETILRHGTRRVAVHAEDEKRLQERKPIAEEAGHPRAHPDWRDERTALLATQRLLTLAQKTGRPVHVLHVTTAEEMALLKNKKDIATVEVTPQHLTLSAPDCYERLGTFSVMNPPIRGIEHQDALWRAIENGTVDVIGSDHAPHTVEDKQKPYPTSPGGMPGVQTLLPVMLNHVSKAKLSINKLVQLISSNPARIFNIKNKGAVRIGNDADFSIVDLKAQRTITNSWIKSKCGWSPFDGMTVTGWPMLTVIRGHIVMQDGEILESPQGEVLQFDKAATAALPKSASF